MALRWESFRWAAGAQAGLTESTQLAVGSTALQPERETSALRDGLTRARELAHAIAHGQIEAWFQPQVDLATGDMIGVEALARWRHPDLGVLFPDRFLPLLVYTDSYHALTDEMLCQAIAFAASTAAAGAPLDVAVNVRAESFLDCGLAARAESLLQACRVRPERLTFELVESAVLDEWVDHALAFEALAALGTRLSIDDFGMGYSSLWRLSVLPVHELKIDRSFVTTMFSNPSMQKIVRSVVALANELGLNSVAEGVESKQAAEVLRGIGCAQAQGHLCAPALAPEVFMQQFVVVDGKWRASGAAPVGSDGSTSW